jgi:hypothetical protein
MGFEQLFNLSFWMWAFGWNAEYTRSLLRGERMPSDTHKKND